MPRIRVACIRFASRVFASRVFTSILLTVALLGALPAVANGQRTYLDLSHDTMRQQLAANDLAAAERTLERIANAPRRGCGRLRTRDCHSCYHASDSKLYQSCGWCSCRPEWYLRIQLASAIRIKETEIRKASIEAFFYALYFLIPSHGHNGHPGTSAVGMLIAKIGHLSVGFEVVAHNLSQYAIAFAM